MIIPRLYKLFVFDFEQTDTGSVLNNNFEFMKDETNGLIIIIIIKMFTISKCFQCGQQATYLYGIPIHIWNVYIESSKQCFCSFMYVTTPSLL